MLSLLSKLGAAKPYDPHVLPGNPADSPALRMLGDWRNLATVSTGGLNSAEAGEEAMYRVGETERLGEDGVCAQPQINTVPLTAYYPGERGVPNPARLGIKPGNYPVLTCRPDQQALEGYLILGNDLLVNGETFYARIPPPAN
jgi:hypothetical protein